MKKEEALVRRSEEEAPKNMDPASYFKPAETIEFRNGTDTGVSEVMVWANPATLALPLNNRTDLIGADGVAPSAPTNSCNTMLCKHLHPNNGINNSLRLRTLRADGCQKTSWETPHSIVVSTQAAHFF